MSPTGYTTIGTILQIEGSPYAAAKSIGYPDISLGSLDTTPLKPTNGYKTKIPDGLIDVKAIDVQAISSPAALANMLVMLEAQAILAFEIDFVDGDAMTFDGFITAIKPGGANEGSPATEMFTISIQPTGEIEFPGAATGNWYDNVDGLAVVDGDFTLANGATKTLEVMAICSGSGFAFIAPNADLDFTSAAGDDASAGLHTGLIT
jgi:hypothetical protein